MNIILTLLLITFFRTNSYAYDCLTDQTILPDGSWTYTGVSMGKNQAGNDRIVISIATESALNKRFLSFNPKIFYGAKDRYEITQCSTPVRNGAPFTFYVNSREFTKLDILQLVKAKIEVIAGRPVVIPSTDGAFLSYNLYYQYSKKGMTNENNESAYFLPGYHLGRPIYDSAGKLYLQWYGSNQHEPPNRYFQNIQVSILPADESGYLIPIF